MISCIAAGQPSPSTPTIENFEVIGHIEKAAAAVSEVDGAAGLSVAGNYAYVVITKSIFDTDDGRFMPDGCWLRTIDVSDPTAPIETALYTVPYSIDTMIASGSHLYIAQGYFGLRVLDMSVPPSSSEVASRTLASSRGFGDMSIVENRVYVSGWRGATESNQSGIGLWMLDISDPAKTDFYTIAEDRVYNMLMADKYILVVRSHTSNGFVASHTFTGSLQIMDGFDPLTVTEVSSVDLLTNVLDMAVLGDHIYVAYGREGLQVIDISDSAKPMAAGFYNTPEGVWSVATNGTTEDYLYVIDGEGAVSVLKFTPD